MTLRSRSAAVAVLAVLLGAGPAAAQDRTPPGADGPSSPVATSSDDGAEPARYPPTSVRWKLVAGGLGLTAASYGIGAACAAAWPEVPGSEALYVPVAGPWITLAQSGCSPDDPGCDAIVVVRGILLVLDGLVQAGGVAVAGEGLFMTTESDTAAASRSARHAAVTVAPVPIVTGERAGLGVVGAF